MATSLVTSTQAAAMGYPPQNKMALLLDGSIIWVDESGASTNTARLYQITNPTTSPTNTQVTGFAPAITSLTQSCSDIFTSTSGDTTDVWIAVGGQAGVAVVQIWHATYTLSTATWSAWTNGNVTNVSSATGDICSIVWTGTNLIAAWRDTSGTTRQCKINYTTTQSGASGWQATAVALDTSSTATHHYITLVHSTSQAVTYAVMGTAESGANAAEAIRYRALLDSNTPAIGNWTADTLISGSAWNLGASNFTSMIDDTNNRLHIAWCDSTTGQVTNPKYISGTISGTTPTFGSVLSVGAGTVAAANPSLSVSEAGVVHLFWESAAVNAAGVIDYVAIPAPYTTASAVTAIPVPGGVTAQYYPNTPKRDLVWGYVPLLFQTATSTPFAIYLDTSIGAGKTPSPILVRQAVNRASTF